MISLQMFQNSNNIVSLHTQISNQTTELDSLLSNMSIIETFQEHSSNYISDDEG